MKLTDYVDVFLGSGGIDLPEPQGVAKTWHFIKGLAGNTTPGAALPFGKLTACAYSGGYSSGYGNIGINTGEPLRKILPDDAICGFSHIQNSGTGFIDTFYNYAVTSPCLEGDPFTMDTIADEVGRPGYYAATMADRGIRGELTVTDQAVHHRYTFPKAGGMIAIDYTNDGLLEQKTRHEYRDMECSVRGDTAECSVVLHDVKLYFCARCPGAEAQLWEKGARFIGLPEGAVRMTMGISAKSPEIARMGAAQADMDFDAIAKAAEDTWEKALAAIEIEAKDERDKRIFYSNFYHTLIKPMDWSGESFLYADEEAFTLDFATLWDQYKTQMPLLFTLYPEISDRIIRTTLAYCRAVGRMPHALMLDRRDAGSEDMQAKMLAEHMLADAYYRGVPMDLEETARQIRQDILQPNRFEDYKASGVCSNIAHTVDIADGCNAARVLAEAAGDAELAEVCRELAAKWVNAFDRETGLLDPKSWYYEGNHWNYSFRLMHDMDTRLDIAGGKEKYAELLDHFFGFACPEDINSRFEGFNNETDMETPYAYYYADRHDRLCEVVAAGSEYMFTEGRGGIPGNNDSGGLSSLYMWNVMGIFPASGQNLMFIGTPRLKRALLHLANGKDFAVERMGSGIYVKRAELNGRTLEKMSFSVQEMMQGGKLVLEMSEKPV